MDARTVRRPIKARKGTWKAAWEAGRGAPLARAFWLVQTLFVRSTAQPFVASTRSRLPNNLFGSDLGIGNNGWNPPPIEHTLLLPVRVPACGGRVKSEWCTRSGRPYLVRTA